MLGPCLGGYKIKYKLLDEFVKEFPDGNMNKIFIDLDCILYSLYNKRLVDSIDFRKEAKSLIKVIFDIVGHYRHYFMSRYRVPSKIYLYYSSSRPSRILNVNPLFSFDRCNTIKNPTFSKLAKYIKEELSVVRDIIKYFPDTYLINSDYLDSELIPMYINDISSKDGEVNIFISTRLKTYQYVNDNSVLFYIGKNNKHIVTKDSMWEKIYDRYKLKSEPPELDISNLPLVFALSGLSSSYALDGVSGMGISSAVKYVYKNIKEAKSLPDTFIYNSYTLELLEELKDKNLRERIENNLKCIYLKYGYNLMTRADKIMISDQILDIPSVDNIHSIDREIFDSSVNTNFVTEGVSFNTTNRKTIDIGI